MFFKDSFHFSREIRRLTSRRNVGNLWRDWSFRMETGDPS